MLKPLKTAVTGGIFRERMNLNCSYLLELDTQCLLQNFYLEAGIIMPGLQVVSVPEHANMHWGWEAPTCQLRGHFLGHWMSAAARLIASEHGNSEKLRWAFRISVHCDMPQICTLKLRVPVWAKNCALLLDDSPVPESPESGYISITREWTNQVLQIRFKSTVTAEHLPDQPELAAMLEGPIVLAGLTDLDCGLHGDPADVLMPRTEHTYSTYPWRQSCYVTRNQPVNFRFIPLYEVNDETYTVYFSLK